jgi:hypothetical protein
MSFIIALSLGKVAATNKCLAHSNKSSTGREAEFDARATRSGAFQSFVANVPPLWSLCSDAEVVKGFVAASLAHNSGNPIGFFPMAIFR